LFPGDILDDDIEPYVRYRLTDTMRKLRAPLGQFAVLGNHEYYGGSIPRFAQEMEDAGIRLLQDECVLVADSFYVVGRKDRTAEGPRFGGRKPVGELLAP